MRQARSSTATQSATQTAAQTLARRAHPLLRHPHLVQTNKHTPIEGAKSKEKAGRVSNKISR